MTMELIEGAIDALKDYLKSNMAPKLDALDAEYGDFKLANIKEWYVAELTAIPSYPAIIILGDATNIPVEGSGWLKGEHDITIACLATDQETERLRRRLYRYIRAVVEVLIASRPTLGYTVTFIRLEFSPLYAREGGFLSDSRLVVRVGRHET